jgi:hypothetical protein
MEETVKKNAQELVATGLLTVAEYDAFVEQKRRADAMRHGIIEDVDRVTSIYRAWNMHGPRLVCRDGYDVSGEGEI